MEIDIISNIYIFISCTQKQYEKRLLFKKLKEEKMEEERQAEDEEERQYQAGLRMAASNKAKRMQFNNLDEVKQFHVQTSFLKRYFNL